MAEGKPWEYDRVLKAPYYDILTTLKLRNQLAKVSERVSELQAEEFERNRKRK